MHSTWQMAITGIKYSHISTRSQTGKCHKWYQFLTTMMRRISHFRTLNISVISSVFLASVGSRWWDALGILGWAPPAAPKLENCNSMPYSLLLALNSRLWALQRTCLKRGLLLVVEGSVIISRHPVSSRKQSRITSICRLKKLAGNCTAKMPVSVAEGFQILRWWVWSKISSSYTGSLDPSLDSLTQILPLKL